MGLPADNIRERERMYAHLQDLDHVDQILFIMACLGTDGMRRVNDFADRAGKPDDVGRAAAEKARTLAAPKPSRWLISFQHTSRDIMHNTMVPNWQGTAIEITDKDPATWLLEAMRRNRAPLDPALHVDRRTHVDAILSAIPIPHDMSQADVDALASELSAIPSSKRGATWTRSQDS